MVNSYKNRIIFTDSALLLIYVKDKHAVKGIGSYSIY